jgi:hypothetical protein
MKLCVLSRVIIYSVAYEMGRTRRVVLLLINATHITVNYICIYFMIVSNSLGNGPTVRESIPLHGV